MILDEERFVGLSAEQSLWILTRHETDFHDWETSSLFERQEHRCKYRLNLPFPLPFPF
jgi:hypothetical protein